MKEQCVMEQINLFDNDMGIATEEYEQNNLADEETQMLEEEVTEYTPEQSEIVDYAKSLIVDSLDPWNPISAYITKRYFYRIDFNDGEDRTVYLELTGEKAVQNSIEKKQMFKNATIQRVIEVDKDSIPAGAKVIYGNAEILSIKMELAFSKPKWFSVTFKKKFYRVQIVENMKKATALLEKVAGRYKVSKADDWLCIDTPEPTHAALMTMLNDIKPLIKDRYVFLYNHRMTASSCCELQSKCKEAGRCISAYREMQMRCGFRKLMERNNIFQQGAKYRGY